MCFFCFFFLFLFFCSNQHRTSKPTSSTRQKYIHDPCVNIRLEGVRFCRGKGGWESVPSLLIDSPYLEAETDTCQDRIQVVRISPSCLCHVQQSGMHAQGLSTGNIWMQKHSHKQHFLFNFSSLSNRHAALLLQCLSSTLTKSSLCLSL